MAISRTRKNPPKTKPRKRSRVYKLLSRDKFQNISKTSKLIPRREKSWKALKDKRTGKTTKQCQRRGCKKRNTVGAHIKVKNKPKKNYIARLCKKDNSASNKKWMSGKAGTTVARVTKKDTMRRTLKRRR